MNTSIKEIKLISPFDAHMHWRQASTLLHKVAKYSMNQFAGGLLMPNTDPKILSMSELEWYRKEINSVVVDPFNANQRFLPIFTFYLSAGLSAQDLVEAYLNGLIHGVKYYPKGGTTNSDKGMDGFTDVVSVLEAMEKYHVPLLIHGEVATDKNGKMIDDFDREKVFYEDQMENLVKNFPSLPISMEHITTKESVDFVLRHKNVVATITPQHLLFDRRALFNGVTSDMEGFEYDTNKNGMHPSVMCRPILKSEFHVDALRNALILQHTNDFKKFGLGTDTAPHTSDKKYCECGACGVFSASIALEMYAMAFEEMGILDHLSTFACDIMPNFYGIKDQLPRKEVILVRKNQQVQEAYDGIVTPFAGQVIPWSVKVS